MTKPGAEPIETTAEEVPDAIPDAQAGEAPAPTVPPLRIGDPFAIAQDCELVETKDGGGCTAVVQCDECSQRFRIDLLRAGAKYCPKCNAAYTHMLLISKTDDAEIVGQAMAIVLIANGFEPPAGLGGDDDEEEDEEEDDEEEDEEDDEPQ